MGTLAILAEKSQAANAFATALGGVSGTFEGQDYVIVHARGHLYELVTPAEMVPESLREKYASWDIGYLPWDENDLSWKLAKRGDVGSLISNLKSTFASCAGIVVATDLDPSGEGGSIGWNIVRELGFENKDLYRMTFHDESPKSLQEGFRKRRKITSIDDEGEFRKSQFRNRWDMLSMQFTRVSSRVAGSKAPLRNGRLKSAMVVLVGDQLEAHHNYVKTPFFENRFRDENGVVYSDKDTDRFATEAEVPGGLHASAVTHDGVTRKKTAPPKLLQLSGLSSMLNKMGHDPKDVLETYQKMYDAPYNWLSYPRTEDKFVSEEQFNEMLPLIDKIAAVVGVDPKLLSQRSPRKGSHVKNGGAHGANRPGLSVPSSLAEVESKFGQRGRVIYETLAKNYLRMLAPDYEYDQHKGHVSDYPTYRGSLSVPAVLGWKGVFTTEKDGDTDEEATQAKGLGSRAEPFVYEGYPPQPPHPSMDWLMTQLERRDVGTSATQVSTYNEVRNNAKGWALLATLKGKDRIGLTDLGSLNYKILPGTHIGSLDLTARVFDQMKEIEKNNADPAVFLAEVKDLVRDDIATMKKNFADVDEAFKSKMAAAGVYAEAAEVIDLPAELHFTYKDKTVVRAKRVWSGHRFTDAEVVALLAGKEISFTATSASTGKEFTCSGKLAGQVMEKSGEKIPYVGFKRTDLITGTYKGKEVSFNGVFSGHTFTQAEIMALLDGQTIEFAATSKMGKSYQAKGALGKGQFGFGFQLDTSGWGNNKSGSSRAGGKAGAKSASRAGSGRGRR